MRSYFPGASGASAVAPEFLQRSRISARVGVSPAVADVMASLAFGTDRRGDVVDLLALTTDRTASAGAVRQ